VSKKELINGWKNVIAYLPQYCYYSIITL